MNGKLKGILALTTIAACTVSSMAVPMTSLYITDGHNSVTIGPSAGGTINYVNNHFDGWVIKVAANGISPGGTPQAPAMLLGVQDLAAIAATLTIELTTVNLGPTSGTFESDLYGTVTGAQTVTGKVYADASNAAFGMGTLLSNHGLNTLVGPNSISEAAPYSLTIVDTIVDKQRGGFVIVSLDHKLTVTNSIPDGGVTIALLGCVLLGAEGLRRKLSK
jgi:hypothetical protein